MAQTSLDVSVLNNIRLFPASRSDATFASSRVTPLSIIDAMCAHYMSASAVWIYDSPASKDTPGLQRSLSVTLDAYPQWAGQVRRSSFEPTAVHTQRWARLELCYNNPDDPGVELVLASSPRTLKSVLPSASERASVGAWDASTFPVLQLAVTTCKLALHDLVTYEGLPSMAVQLTSFACGALAITVSVVHVLADAQSLLGFMHDWASVHRALSADPPLPLPDLKPIFDPQALDRFASGDIDAAHADPALLEVAQELPLNRNDLWISSEHAPLWAQRLVAIPPELEIGTVQPRGTRVPWELLDMSAPVSHRILHFTRTEVARVRMKVETELGGSEGAMGSMSKLDALLAHVWRLIVRARGLVVDNANPVHLSFALNLRSRISPPLPPTFLGSPVVLAHAISTSSKAGASAASIRRSLTAFTPERVGAMLHEMCHLESALRLWGGSVGERWTMVTTWVRLGLCEVDFGFGGLPTFAQQLIGDADGLLQVQEAAGQVSKGAKEASSNTTQGWWEKGVDVSVKLRSDVMERLLQDPTLRR